MVDITRSMVAMIVMVSKTRLFRPRARKRMIDNESGKIENGDGVGDHH